MKTRILLSLVSVALLVVGCNGTSEGKLVDTQLPDIDNGNGNPNPGGDTSGAKLSSNLQASPWMLSVGQELKLDITITNSGDTTASSVMPSTPIQTGSGHAALKATPIPIDLKAGETELFEFTYTTTDSGSI